MVQQKMLFCRKIILLHRKLDECAAGLCPCSSAGLGLSSIRHCMWVNIFSSALFLMVALF